MPAVTSQDLQAVAPRGNRAFCAASAAYRVALHRAASFSARGRLTTLTPT